MRRIATVTAITLLSSAASMAAQTNRTGWPTLPVTGLGTAIAMSGENVVVGRPGEFALFPLNASRPGGVAVFAPEGDGWTEIAAVSADDGTVGNAFGQALVVDGDRIVVGAPKEADGVGAVYVFTRDGSGWVQSARIDPENGQVGDAFGTSVGAANDRLAIGAPGTANGMGAVHTFRLINGAWSSTGTVTGEGLAPGDGFGTSVSINGDLLVAGAPGPMPFALLAAPQPPRPGKAYAFRSAPDGWSIGDRLTAAGTVAFGFVVQATARGALVSAPLSGGGAGAIYRFVSTQGEWTARDTVPNPSGSQGTLFGFSMHDGGDHLVVGQPFWQGGRGAARVFDPSGNGWQEVARLDRTLTGMQTFYGGAVASGDNLVIVGAPGADFFEGVGVAYAADDAGEWTEVATLIDEAEGMEAITGGQLDCDDGSINEFACGEVDLMSFIPTRDLGAERGIMVNDVWGWTDSLTGKEYAIVGRTDATTFIDLSDPANPVYLGYLPLSEDATINVWRDIKVYRNHAYIVADAAGQHGMQIFDMAQLRTVTNPPVRFEETARYDNIASAHNVVINERTGFAYSVGSSSGGETCGGGLHMIDIREPANPTFAGCFSDTSTGNASTGYSHDAQCIVYSGPDEDYSGREICFGSNETALSIADVTDKENPVAVSTGQYPSVTYAHQGWVSEDHRHFYMNDEGDELVGGTPRTRTLVWDIEDLDDPVLLTEFMGTTQASDHNLYIRGNFMYQSNYVSGLRIIDISDPAQPVEVGFFDTVPTGENTPGFAGSWSNFPYFDSGIIVVTSMREGVFILKKRDQRPVP